MSATQNTGHAAAVVLSVLSELPPEQAIVPGEWETLLVRLCLKSDQTNLGILTGAFGAIPAAVWLYKNVDGGLDVLKAQAADWKDRR